VVASVPALPAALAGCADEVRIQFPWGSLLRAVLDADRPAVDGIVGLMAPGASLTVLVSVAEHDRVDGRRELDGPEARRIGLRLAEAGGLALVECRPMSAEDVAASHSTWAKRLGAGRSRPAWVVGLRRNDLDLPGSRR
jgi:16S rRNA (adenine(1408)-N(1))-methyltransferase